MSTYISSILKPRKRVRFHTMSSCNQLQEIAWLTRRLFLQAARRPSGFISGLIQPLLWLLLFGGLFQNIPLNLFGKNNYYGPFLSCGIIAFTSFTGSLNAGLPVIFDREFGFLNRLLVAPMASKYTIVLAATLFMICITMMQNSIIAFCSFKYFNFCLDYYRTSLIFLVLLIITSSISSLSLSLAFISPGHIEFLALILIVNLPMLFASTALAPIYFMPYWLQIITKFNLLTYAIEAIRFIAFDHINSYDSHVIQIFNNTLSLSSTIKILTASTCISFLAAKYIISHKIE